MRFSPPKRVLSLIGISAVTAGMLVSAPALAAAGPTLAWGPCGEPTIDAEGFQCATLAVPKDRKRPNAGTFNLAVIRHPSTGTPDQRIGSLVFNPGGPGGSGLNVISPIWSQLPDEVKARFDLVTWDPRGVGMSSPALEGCESPWPARPATGPVNWANVAKKFQKTLAKANAACEKKNAALVPYLGTNDNVEDLDKLREAIGDDKLTFWGISYGTRIGYIYALKYPKRTRALVLDGSIDPAGTTRGLNASGSASDQAFGSFAQAYPNAAAQIRQVLAKLDKTTVALPGGKKLTRWGVIDAFYGAVPQERNWPALNDGAAVLYAAVFGTGDEQAAAARAARQIVAPQPNSNAGGVFSVVNCLDYSGRPSLKQAIADIKEQHKYGPVNGAATTTSFALGCSGLKVKPDPVPLITGQGSKVPVLVLGSTRDGSTPALWTARMSRAFPASRTVTYAGGQHGTWITTNGPCVNSVANDYVNTLTLPATDLGCPNSFQKPDSQ